MRQILLTLCLLCLSIVPTIAQDTPEPPDISDVIGLSVPQAEAFLNRLEYRLNPVLINDFSSDATLNTIIGYEITEDNQVSLSVARETNMRLVWDISAYLEGAAFLGDLDGDELFTVVNLSDEDIPLRNIQIADFNAVTWGTSLRAGQCVQAWTFNEINGYRLPDCESVQGGILNLVDRSQQFWRNEDSFDVFQNGIHRATCQQSDGTCTLWVSPTVIAEEIAPYIYFIYDTEQWIVYNNSATQWIDLSQVSINDQQVLADARNWDSIRIADLERLAPNQCLRFTQNAELETLTDCDEIAVQEVAVEGVFWIDSFTVNDSLNVRQARQCPASLGERTICLLGR